MPDNQDAVIAFLRDPASYGPEVARVDVIETHISVVFLAGDRVYKLKRAVQYSYLDFSTEPRRRAMCEAELALNRRTAPDLYLAVKPVTRDADGAIGWAEDGVPLDWVVVMRRFDQDLLLDAVARKGGLSPALLQSLAAHIVEFHAEAEIRRDGGGRAAIGDIVRVNLRCLRDTHSAGFPPDQIDDVERRAIAEAARVGMLLDRRRETGKVRRCHGDLHLRNIFLHDGKPVMFDCIEFSDAVATIDVLYDLAFLLMDFTHRGHADCANFVFNRYLDLTGDDDGLPAMPLFLAMRAVIRAHVTATALDRGWGAGATDAAADARRYLDEARTALCPLPARLVAIGGLSGSGKSTLAARLAQALGTSPGARLLRSDVIRKRRFGAAPETALPPDAYTPRVSALVYDEICGRASVALAAGRSAIIDAVALSARERREFAAVAGRAGVPFDGIWLDAPEPIMAARISARRGDASDASPEILGRQMEIDPGPLDWVRIDAGTDPEITETAARRVLGLP